MKTVILALTGLLCLGTGFAQRACSFSEYKQQQLNVSPALMEKTQAIETFMQQHLFYDHSNSSRTARTTGDNIIRIPVVVHILYHYPAENIGDLQVQKQIDALNRDFRKLNTDTDNIPVSFRALAADTEIEFQLASVDPKGRATSGIIHKYTPIEKWTMDDKIKSSAEMGDDAWDASSYLNIWVGNLHRLDGYASVPGADKAKDGLVISTNVFGNHLGRTAVHEAGHWLGLRHLWGDEECGDDLVHDTPQQRGFTPGCPTGVRLSCENSSSGDMYMNYMDFTSDACINMFTNGQKQRMRSLFAPGGIRNSLLNSKALGAPTSEEITLPEASPQWLHIRLYPNPATSNLTLNFEYDERWMGEELVVANSTGLVVLRNKISSKLENINIAGLKPGIYFIIANRKDGEKIRQKFVKI